MKRRNFAKRKAERKADAAIRQAAYDRLSVEQKLARLDVIAGCVKQRKKLS